LFVLLLFRGLGLVLVPFAFGQTNREWWWWWRWWCGGVPVGRLHPEHSDDQFLGHLREGKNQVIASERPLVGLPE